MGRQRALRSREQLSGRDGCGRPALGGAPAVTKLLEVSIAWIATIAPSEGGFVEAMDSAVLPPYEMPQMPVRPLHQGWPAIHASAS
jgi:hypothetical protein